jgi:Flagellar hook-length control protein FliK
MTTSELAAACLGAAAPASQAQGAGPVCAPGFDDLLAVCSASADGGQDVARDGAQHDGTDTGMTIPAGETKDQPAWCAMEQRARQRALWFGASAVFSIESGPAGRAAPTRAGGADANEHGAEDVAEVEEEGLPVDRRIIEGGPALPVVKIGLDWLNGGGAEPPSPASATQGVETLRAQGSAAGAAPGPVAPNRPDGADHGARMTDVRLALDRDMPWSGTPDPAVAEAVTDEREAPAGVRPSTVTLKAALGEGDVSQAEAAAPADLRQRPADRAVTSGGLAVAAATASGTAAADVAEAAGVAVADRALPREPSVPAAETPSAREQSPRKPPSDRVVSRSGPMGGDLTKGDRAVTPAVETRSSRVVPQAVEVITSRVRDEGRGTPAWSSRFELPAPLPPPSTGFPVPVVGPRGLAVTDAEGSLDTQIVQALKMVWQGDGGEARIRLRPEHLGDLTIALRVEGGAVSAHLVASAPEVRQWIEANEAVLRQSLQQHHLELERLVVTDGDAHADTTPHREHSGEPRERPKRQSGHRGQPTFEVVV